MMRLPTVPLPLPLVLVALLATTFVLPGLIGHDPWKTNDAVGIGIVHQFLNGGGWLVPKLAGEPYLEDGPLFYWLAALIAKLLGGVLPLHDAARLASGLAFAAALVFIRLAGKTLYGATQGSAALLALLGCLGLLVHVHETAAEIGSLAGLAAAYWGLVLARSRPLASGLALAGGLAAAFLCKGPLVVLAPAVTALALPLLSREWRSRPAFAALMLGLVAGVALAALWPLALYLESPQLYRDWLTAVFPRPSGIGFFYQLQTIAWAAWPAWPLALWELWRRRRTLAAPEVLLPFIATLAALVEVFAFAPESRDIQMLPLMPPLALLAGSAVDTLRRGATNAFAWFGAMTFSLFGLLVWLGWFAMMTGLPPPIARSFTRLEPGFTPHFAWLPFVAALILSAAWTWLILRAGRSPHRSLVCWAAGVTLLWGLLMMLWLPWIDYGKSYRSVALSLKNRLPQEYARLARASPGAPPCIESRGLGEAQRAVFHYHAGVVTQRAEVFGDSGCPLLLVQSGPQEAQPPGWRRVWEGNRPRDRERYRLYIKN